MKNRVIKILAGIVLMSGWASAGLIYSNSFTGVASANIAAVAEVGSGQFHHATSFALSGDGKLVITNTGYNVFGVRLGASAGQNIIGVDDAFRISATIKAPSDGTWVGLGFTESTDGINLSGGPWLQVNPTSYNLRGGKGTLGSNIQVTSTHAAGDVLNVELTWYKGTSTADLIINGNLVQSGVGLGYTDGAGGTVPNIQYAQVRFMNTGVGISYVDNLVVETIPEPATLGLFGISSAGLLAMRKLMN